MASIVVISTLKELILLSPGDEGHLMWGGNWVTFLDTMLQMMILGVPGRSLQLPTRITALRVDPTAQQDRVIHIDSERTGE